MTMRIVALAAAFIAAGSIASAATATAKATIDGSLVVTSASLFRAEVEETTGSVGDFSETGAGVGYWQYMYGYDFIQAEALADALSDGDSASASVELDLGVTFFNLENVDVTLTVEYSLDLLAEALAGDRSEAFAQAFFSVEDGAGLSVTEVVLADSLFGLPLDTRSFFGSAEIRIAANGSTRFNVFATVDAAASVAPIPLPAAAPLLLLALGGLVALRRRA